MSAGNAGADRPACAAVPKAGGGAERVAVRLLVSARWPDMLLLGIFTVASFAISTVLFNRYDPR